MERKGKRERERERQRGIKDEQETECEKMWKIFLPNNKPLKKSSMCSSIKYDLPESVAKNRSTS